MNTPRTDYVVHYSDGTMVKGLNFEESQKLFFKALGTNNSATTYPENYKANN